MGGACSTCTASGLRSLLGPSSSTIDPILAGNNQFLATDQRLLTCKAIPNYCIIYIIFIHILYQDHIICTSTHGLWLAKSINLLVPRSAAGGPGLSLSQPHYPPQLRQTQNHQRVQRTWPSRSRIDLSRSPDLHVTFVAHSPSAEQPDIQPRI